MKILSLFVFLLIPFLVHGQNYPNIDEQQMQAMMENAKKMEVCMKNIDQDEIKALEQQAKKMESEVKTLCAAGKRDEAQEKAMQFGVEAANNDAMKEMAKCGEMMKEFIPKSAGVSQYSEKDWSQYHICDY